MADDPIIVRSGELIGWTVNKAPWGPRVQWHPVFDRPCVPRKLPESYQAPAPVPPAGSGGGGSTPSGAQGAFPPMGHPGDFAPPLPPQQQYMPPGPPGAMARPLAPRPASRGRRPGLTNLARAALPVLTPAAALAATPPARLRDLHAQGPGPVHKPASAQTHAQTAYTTCTSISTAGPWRLKSDRLQTDRGS